MLAYVAALILLICEL